MFIHAQAADRKTKRTYGPFKSVTVSSCSIQVYEEGDDGERIFAVLNPSGVWESDDGRFTKFEITGA